MLIHDLQGFKIFKMASTRGNTVAEGGGSAVKLSDFNCCLQLIKLWVSDFCVCVADMASTSGCMYEMSAWYLLVITLSTRRSRLVLNHVL